MKRRFGAPDLFQDVGGFGGPDERFGSAAVLLDVSQDGMLQVGDAGESSTPELILA